jgi:hypothetical protein
MPTTKVRTKLFFFSCHEQASKFSKLSKATEAAEAYSLDRGYPCEPFFCDACKRYHMRQSEAPREIPEEDRWLPSRHRALRDRIKAKNQARHAEEERLRELKSALQEEEKLEAHPKEFVRCKRVRVSACDERSESESRKAARDQRRAAGLCTVCGGTRPPVRNTCERCHARNKKTAAAYRQRKAIAA